MVHNNVAKICPFMSGPVTYTDDTLTFHSGCKMNDCQLYTSVNTTEGFTVWGCAFELGARTNSEGKIPV